MMGDRGFDEATVERADATAARRVLDAAIAARSRRKTSTRRCRRWRNDKDLATKLAVGVKTRDDLADLATDDLVRDGGSRAERARAYP